MEPEIGVVDLHVEVGPTSRREDEPEADADVEAVDLHVEVEPEGGTEVLSVGGPQAEVETGSEEPVAETKPEAEEDVEAREDSEEPDAEIEPPDLHVEVGSTSPREDVPEGEADIETVGDPAEADVEPVDLHVEVEPEAEADIEAGEDSEGPAEPEIVEDFFDGSGGPPLPSGAGGMFVDTWMGR